MRIASFFNNQKLVPYLRSHLPYERSVTLKNLIRYLLQYEKSDIRLRKITPLWIENFQSFLLTKAKISQGTASLYSSALRKQLHLAVKERIIVASPADSVRNIPMPESNKMPLTLDNLKNLSKIPITGHLGAEIKNAFLFSCFTGLRVSDLRDLSSSMIYKDSTGIIWLRKIQKKTKRVVTIPINQQAVSILGANIESKNGKIFPLLAATKTNTDQYLSTWGKKAGIPHVSWHTARHTFATLALENGAELRTVSELLGHADISTTLRYAKATDFLKKKAINRLPKLEL